MCEAERIKLEEKLLGGVAVKDANIEYGEKISEGKRGIETYWVDGWVFPIIEVKRVQEYRKSLLEPTDFYSGRADSSIKITSSDLHSRITNAYGVLLFRSVSLPPSPSLLVETPSAVQAIQELGLKLSRGLPTLITSPPGAGKSFFINHLSSRLFQSQNQVVAIHLSDTSLDPRSLLGSYISSPLKPGTFKWVEGALVRAMREGKWVVLEDIDKASGEVLGTLMPLVESLGITKEIGKRAEIQVHGRPKVVAAESFALFATRSIPVNINQDELHVPSPTFLGHQHWVEVQIPAPTHSEQVLILSTKFPRLAGRVLLALLDIWEAIQGLSGSEKGRSGIQYGNTARSVGMRDVEKWINRVNALISPALFSQEDDVMTDGPSSVLTLAEVLPNTTAREEILLETYVIFAGYIPPSSTRALSSFITVLGNKLGLSEERVRWVIESRTPSLEVQKNPVNAQIEVIHIGNSKLHAHRNDAQGGSSTPARPFALHRPSLVLLQHLASCVQHQEPLLLVGETGTGKTTSIGYLAGLVGQQLVAINLSNQTETSDLLGGFKPVDVKVPASQLQSRFAELFDGTFSLRRNGPFWEEVRKSFTAGKWKRVVNMWKEGVSKAKKRFNVKEKQETDDPSETRDLGADSPRKRRKVEDNAGKPALEDWTKFERDVLNFEIQHVTSQNKFVFDFVEGPLVNAIKAGHWVLLDEINLASSETLEALAPLLQSTSSSITLTEQGSLTPVPRHPSFRLFASMNPATDVGKKDLPPNLRSRFTEIYVPPPDHDREALLAIITQYIGQVSAADKAAIMDVAEFYSEVRQLADTRVIADGSNKRPHFSMRTLARALMFTVDVASSFGLRRALWEGCLMAFTMSLDEKSASLVVPLMERWILRGVSNVSALLNQIPILPSNGQREDFVQVGPFWLLKGPGSPQEAPEYILTPSVQKKLMDLSRIILTRRFPVLIEGPTSAGKTSAIEYLAKRSGHRFVRINNHEHTDIQEYIGTYVSDPETGRLIFRDGLLVRALRNGDWIVLDELNLAPTDVLEALNRLLDDNRELFVSETQEIIRPHPSFMLFATQNPSGVYAGRKVLSRAFRNRFLDVHFGDVPQDELEIILSERTRIPRSRAKLIVSVFRELQKRRQSGRVFETKQSFATLRDLFRWAERDWKEVEEVGNRALAEAGYMLLAERTRKEDDRLVVKEVIEQILKVRIDDTKLYHLSNPQTDLRRKLGLRFEDLPGGLIWTSTLQRTFTLVFNALSHNEPVLLVGETGCGKTSVCELFATMMGQKLTTVSCHQNTETADLLGGQRPVRNRGLLQNQVLSDIRTTLLTIGAIANSEGSDANTLLSLLDSTIFNKSHSPPILEQLRELRARLKSVTALFEWRDGPLVDAMRNGDVLLLDEISLADDSVLERLNSVLEPSRTLILAEKGGWDLDAVRVVASPSFKLIATMNPGGDYGKKELSPALRNRFTEIWVPQVNSRTDRLLVIESMWEHEELRRFGPLILDFCEWLAQELGEQGAVGLRDLIAWITFSNRIFGTEPSLSAEAIFHHAAHMTFIDGLRSIPQTAGHSVMEILELQSRCRHRLNELVPLEGLEGRCLSSDDKTFRIGSFGISRGPHISAPLSFNLEAPTARENALRILRASQVVKPILLEGSPGVGKTTLVSALANAAGHRLCRINLSDQTDLMDLFGSDLPVEGGKAGEFVWKDAAFLQALQDGDWVLLDEMNLAPQAVLEGLNAVLDHRGMVYIPELSRSFQRHPNFRIFAAQNPLGQGGGRKGLPKSFLNRFTKVYIQEMSPSDVLSICHQLFPQHPMESLKKMIQFNAKLYEETMMRHRFGQDGSPWEFNLRDVLRWSSLLDRTTGLEIYGHPKDHLGSVYLQRFRSATDRSHVSDLFSTIFGSSLQYHVRPIVSISPDYVQWGHHLRIRQTSPIVNRPSHVLHAHHHALEAIGSCLDQGWLVILCGPQLSGKTTLIQQLADISGVVLRTVPMNQAMDTADLLGSFEQVDVDLKLHLLRSRMRERIAKLSACMSGVNISPFRDWLLGPMVTSRAERADHLRTWMDSYGLGSDIVLRSILDEILSLAVDDQEVQTFEWVDGPLVQAVKEGQWLLLDNANLCNPSVLDRLNSLCEMNGTLALTERGLINGEVQILTPHPQFRLFMTVNPRQGELSRPMRNRGIEIVLDSMHSSGDLRVLATAARLPAGFEQRSYIKTESSYHLCRRGLSNFSESHLSVGSHVGGVVNDSVSTHALAVLEHYSSLDPTSSFANQQACVETLLRSVIPAALNQVRRSVVYLLRDPQSTSLLASIMEKAFGYPLIELSASLKDQVASKGISTGFLFSQPIDILLNPNLTARYEDNFRSDPTTVLNAVNLILRLQLLDSHSSSSISHGLTVLARSRQAATSVAELQRGVAELYPLMDSTEHVARAILMEMKYPQNGTSSVLYTMCKIVAYTSRLQTIASSRQFDYSSTLAVLSWFDSIDWSDRRLDEVNCRVQNLQKALRNTTGRAMRQIWSHWLKCSDIIQPNLLEKVHQLSRLAQHSQGNRHKILELIAVLGLSQTKTSEHQAQIDSMLPLLDTPQDILGKQIRPSLADSYHLCLYEFHVLSSTAFMNFHWGQTLKILIEDALRCPYYPITRLAPLQRVYWKGEIAEGELCENNP
ncbi:hypothetical protein FRC02_003546 [Tulasnella sp. 418]|nr:hypothetical protein FRC02_003546 [Tulasnella sp. 418]